MKQVVVVRLEASSEQTIALLGTLEAFNAACRYIAVVAYQERLTNKYRLQKLVYRDTREKFGISAQMTVRAIAKVCEAYKRDKRILPKFRPHGAMSYDERIYSLKGLDSVSLLTLEGRVVLPMRFGPSQLPLLQSKRGQADLLYRDKGFYLSISVETPEPATVQATEFLGVDLGIVRIATTSEGASYSGRGIQNVRARYARFRAKLQRKGTKSARRLLRKRRRRERRFQTDLNHCISKALVTRAKDTARGIALEDLSGIRERVTVGKGLRRVIHSWAFRQLRSFVEYKARLAGVRVVLVDPRNTSRTCPECGCIDKANRPSQALFSCTSCGYTANADENAARIISVRAGQPCHAA